MGASTTFECDSCGKVHHQELNLSEITVGVRRPPGWSALQLGGLVDHALPSPGSPRFDLCDDCTKAVVADRKLKVPTREEILERMKKAMGDMPGSRLLPSLFGTISPIGSEFMHEPPAPPVNNALTPDELRALGIEPEPESPTE